MPPGGIGPALQSGLQALEARIRALDLAIANVVQSLALKIGQFIHKMDEVFAKIFSWQNALGVVSGALGLFASALTISIRVANEFSAVLSSIRAQNGIGFSSGLRAVNNLGAFGISPGDAGGILGNPAMNPLIAQMRFGALGFGSGDFSDRHTIMNLASRYQAYARGGPLGRILANSQLDSAFGGQAPESVRNIVNLPQNLIRQQLDYSAGTQKALGINPQALQEYAEKLPLLSARITQFVQLLEVKFATELFPFIEKVLDGATKYLSENGHSIGEIVNRVVRWISIDMPAGLIRFGAGLLHGWANIEAGFGSFIIGLADFSTSLIGAFDTIAGNLRDPIANIVAGFAFLVQTLKNTAVALVNPLALFTGSLPSPAAAGAAAGNAYYTANPLINSSGAAQKQLDSLRTFGADLQRSGKYNNNIALGYDNAADNWIATMTKKLDSIDRNTGATATNTYQGRMAALDMIRAQMATNSIIGRITAYQNEDAVLAVLGTGGGATG